MEYVNIFSQGLAVVSAAVCVRKLRSNLTLLPQLVSVYTIAIWSLAQRRFNLRCPSSFIVTLNIPEHTCLRVRQRILA